MRTQGANGWRLRICPEARPPVVGRMLHHARPHRVQLDIPVARQHIAFVLGEARPKSAFPERPTTLVGSIHILHVALPEPLHQDGHGIDSGGAQQDMNVVCHEDIGVYRTSGFGRVCPQAVKIEAVVLLRKETRLAIVASLNQVHRDAGHDDSRAARHIDAYVINVRRA